MKKLDIISTNIRVDLLSWLYSLLVFCNHARRFCFTIAVISQRGVAYPVLVKIISVVTDLVLSTTPECSLFIILHVEYVDTITLVHTFHFILWYHLTKLSNSFFKISLLRLDWSAFVRFGINSFGTWLQKSKYPIGQLLLSKAQ